METRHVSEKLARSHLGLGLGEEELRRLAEAGEVRQADRGEVLMEEGVPGRLLVVVLDGEVEILKRDDGGEPHRLARMGADTVLGEVGLLLEEPSSATVRVTRPSSLFLLDRERFRTLLEGDRASATPLLLALARIVARRLRRMNERAVELCEEYEEALSEAGTARGGARLAELARFKEQLQSEWNF